MNSKEMFEVWNRVRAWEPEMRIDLVRRILETVVPPLPLTPTQTTSPAEVQTNPPPTTDQEYKKIIEEERLKRSLGGAS